MSGSVESPIRARQIDVPGAARELCTLPRIDYEDCHVLQTEHAHDRTAEEWARALLEDAPDSMRRTLRTGWASLGLRLGSVDDPERVLGWRIGHSDPDAVVLRTDGGRFGLDGEVLLMREDDALMVPTFLQLDGPAARGVWVPVGPMHREVVRRVLEHGVPRATSDG